MSPDRRRRLLILAALFTALLAAVRWSGSPARVEGPRIRGELPADVGAWRGQGLRYCQNESCLAAFTESELDGAAACPRCGGALDSLFLGEKRLLPADTTILRRRYERPGVPPVTVSAVISGTQRASLHRPQWCLPGQGLRIVSSRVTAIPVRGRGELRVMLLGLIPERNARAGGLDPEAFFAYWFAGNRRETPHHAVRLFWMACDSLLHNRQYRWTYFAAAMPASGSPERTRRLLSAFIGELYPLVDAGDPPSAN